MKLNLLHTDDDENVLNKTFTPISSFNIHLSQQADLKNLVLRLHVSDYDYKKVNYAQLDENFYFVETRYYNKNIYLAILNLDYLQTYKDTILNSTLDVKHKSKAGKDIRQSNTSEKTITKIYKSDTTIKKGSTIIAQTTGSKLEGTDY